MLKDYSKIFSLQLGNVVLENNIYFLQCIVTIYRSKNNYLSQDEGATLEMLVLLLRWCHWLAMFDKNILFTGCCDLSAED